MDIGPTSTSAYAIVPTSGYVNTGLISLLSDSDGFESPVDIDVSGVTISTGSESEDTSELNSNQISAINYLASGWSDSDTDREWKMIEFALTSSQAQTVTLTGLALGYTIFENVSDISNPISQYHSDNTQGDTPPVEIAIPVTISSSTGSVSIDGELVYDFIMTNRDFRYPIPCIQMVIPMK